MFAKFKRAAALSAVGVFALTPSSLHAQEDLRSKVDELEQQLRVLKRQLELDKEGSVEKAKTTPVLSAGAGGFSIRSADTNFVLKVRGYFQTDARFYADDHSGGTANDTFLLRRVRPIFEGAVYDKFDYRLMLDFGSGVTSSASNDAYVQDVYGNVRLYPGLQIQAGKFKEPVGLERLQSGANLLFVERSLPTQLLPNRDAGVQVHGELLRGALNYAAGFFNGVADGGSGDIETADDEKDLAGRIFAQPFKESNLTALRGLGLGIAGTYGNQEGALRSYASPGQQRFFGYRTGAGTSAATANVVADGGHWRLTPQAYYYWGPFGLLAEYAISDQEIRRDDGASTFGNVQHTAWQVAASYFVTGEENSFRAVTPRRPFTLREPGWGALELKARVSQIDIDDAAFPAFANPATSASGATAWAVGLNWHLNRNFKVQLDYEQTDFAGGSGSFLDNGEKVVLTRAQISF